MTTETTKPASRVELHDGHTTVLGPDGMELFRLVTISKGLSLEIRCPDLKLSRTGSALKFAKQVTGLGTNDRAKQKARIDAMVEELRAKVPTVDMRG